MREKSEMIEEMAQYELRDLLDEKGPVAYVTGYNNGFPVVESTDTNYLLPVGMALYRAPRKWVGLTDEEIEDCWDGYLSDYQLQMVRSMEAMLKEKNT